jgi:hypothetical protein
MSHYWRISTALAVSLIASPLAAQSASRDTTTPSAAPIVTVASSVVPSVNDLRASLVAPTRANARIDKHPRAAEIVPTRAMMPTEVGRSPAMMIVGGAAIVVGAVVGGRGGAAVAIGGGVLGLLGLWNYLR